MLSVRPTHRDVNNFYLYARASRVLVESTPVLSDQAKKCYESLGKTMSRCPIRQLAKSGNHLVPVTNRVPKPLLDRYRSAKQVALTLIAAGVVKKISLFFGFPILLLRFQDAGSLPLQ